MITPLETAKLYFELSNRSDLNGIENLFTDSSTYSSPRAGFHRGRSSIMAMQCKFHSQFSSLKWNISSITEMIPCVILIEFDFVGTTFSGEKVETLGFEYITLHNDTIQHIEIRDKASGLNDIVIGNGNLDGKGAYAARDFRKGEVVIAYNLKPLSKEDYSNLPESEKQFTHTHWGQIHLYGIPERYVNHSSDPNTSADLKNKCDVALRDIKKGEAITTDALKDDV